MSQTLLKLLPDGAGNEQVSVSIRSLKDSSVVIANTISTNVVFDADYKKINLLSDTTITFSGGIKDGQQLVLALVQADTIPHTVTFSNVRLGSDIFSIPVLSTTLGKTDRFMFFYDLTANTYDLLGYARGF
ncbi:MAG: hypothetical protein JHC33_13570 [Ignisphaera sp.]|nr:hypothetical protein [Ignisphaera sp.]